MKKQTGGPVTKAGKAVSSGNALKHGATSKRFINPEEQTQYLALVEALNTQYSTENPLAKFQIERVARINVQLQGIQDTIDATFEVSRIEAHSPPQTVITTLFEDKPKSRTADEIKHFDQITQSKITRKLYTTLAKELIKSNHSAILTHHGFLSACPKFCQYLFEQAKLEGMRVEIFIEKKFATRIDRNIRFLEKFKESMKRSNPELYLPMQEGVSMEQAIHDVQWRSLQSAAKWLVEELELIEACDQIVADMDKLKSIQVLATTPDLDKLDKLMRYQTSLQRQLSTAMGGITCDYR